MPKEHIKKALITTKYHLTCFLCTFILSSHNKIYFIVKPTLDYK